MTSERRFELSENAGDFLIGKLDGERHSGAYLSPEFLARLRAVHRAAVIRLADTKSSETADAVKNLVGIVGRLLTTHMEQLRREPYQPNEEEEREMLEIEEELRQLQSELENFHGPRDPTKK